MGRILAHGTAGVPSTGRPRAVPGLEGSQPTRWRRFSTPPTVRPNRAASPRISSARSAAGSAPSQASRSAASSAADHGCPARGAWAGRPGSGALPRPRAPRRLPRERHQVPEAAALVGPVVPPPEPRPLLGERVLERVRAVRAVRGLVGVPQRRVERAGRAVLVVRPRGAHQGVQPPGGQRHRPRPGLRVLRPVDRDDRDVGPPVEHLHPQLVARLADRDHLAHGVHAGRPTAAGTTPACRACGQPGPSTGPAAPDGRIRAGGLPRCRCPGAPWLIMTTSETSDEPGVAGLDATALRPWNVVAIAVSAISPTTSVFLVYGSVLEVSGTGVVWAFVVGALIALAMALCYAEVGSVFPSAGGVYALVRGALGPVAGGVTAVLFMLLGLVSTASILVAAATYVGALTPGGVAVHRGHRADRLRVPGTGDGALDRSHRAGELGGGRDARPGDRRDRGVHGGGVRPPGGRGGGGVHDAGRAGRRHARRGGAPGRGGAGALRVQRLRLAALLRRGDPAGAAACAAAGGAPLGGARGRARGAGGGRGDGGGARRRGDGGRGLAAGGARPGGDGPGRDDGAPPGRRRGDGRHRAGREPRLRPRLLRRGPRRDAARSGRPLPVPRVRAVARAGGRDRRTLRGQRDPVPGRRARRADHGNQRGHRGDLPAGGRVGAGEPGARPDAAGGGLPDAALATAPARRDRRRRARARGAERGRPGRGAGDRGGDGRRLLLVRRRLPPRPAPG